MVIDDSGLQGKVTETERKSIHSSLGVLASTPYATVPFNRNLGLEFWLPEDNSEEARNEYAAEVMEQAEIWEDRAVIREIQFESDTEVRMVITDDGY